MKRLTALIIMVLALLMSLSTVVQASPKARSTAHTKPAWMGDGIYTPKTAAKEADCYGTHAATTVIWTSKATRFFDMGNFCISDNYSYRFVGQEDGNLVMYGDIWNKDFPDWASNTEYIGRYVGLSKAGDINVYDVNGALIWSNWAHMHIVHRATSKTYKLNIEIVSGGSRYPHCHIGHYLATEQFFDFAHNPKYNDYEFPSLIQAGYKGVEYAGNCPFITSR